MKKSKPTKQQLLVTALGIAIVLLFFPSLFAQDLPPLTDQNDPLVSMGSPFLDEQSAPSGPRQLGNVPDDIGHQLLESDETVDAICPYGPLTPIHRIWDCGTGHLK